MEIFSNKMTKENCALAFHAPSHLHIMETHLQCLWARVASVEEHELCLLQVARRQTLLQVASIKERTLTNKLRYCSTGQLRRLKTLRSALSSKGTRIVRCVTRGITWMSQRQISSDITATFSRRFKGPIICPFVSRLQWSSLTQLSIQQLYDLRKTEYLALCLLPPVKIHQF